MSLLRPEDLLKSREQRPHRVPVMRDCIKCGLRLPSTQFWSWQISRFSVTKLVRDGMCHACREVEGTTKEQIYDKMMSYLERGGGNDTIPEIVIM